MANKDMFLSKMKAFGESKGLKAPDNFGIEIEAEDDTGEMTLKEHIDAIKSMPDYDLGEVIKMLVTEEKAEDTLPEML